MLVGCGGRVSTIIGDGVLGRATREMTPEPIRYPILLVELMPTSARVGHSEMVKPEVVQKAREVEILLSGSLRWESLNVGETDQQLVRVAVGLEWVPEESLFVYFNFPFPSGASPARFIHSAIILN